MAVSLRDGKSLSNAIRKVLLVSVFVVFISIRYLFTNVFGCAYTKPGIYKIVFTGAVLFTAEGHQDEGKWNGSNAMFDGMIKSIHHYAINGSILVASFAITYVAMALRLFLTSFKAFNIINHLFVVSDRIGFLELSYRGAHSVEYTNSSTSKGFIINDSVHHT